MKKLKGFGAFLVGALTLAFAVASGWALLSLVGALAEWLGGTQRAWNPSVELLGEHYWAMGLGAVGAAILTCAAVLGVIVLIVIPVSEFGQRVLSSVIRRHPK